VQPRTLHSPSPSRRHSFDKSLGDIPPLVASLANAMNYSTTMSILLCAGVATLLLSRTDGFLQHYPTSSLTRHGATFLLRSPEYHTTRAASSTCHRSKSTTELYQHNNNNNNHNHPFRWRFNTIEAAGLENALSAGVGGGKISSLVNKVKTLPRDVKKLTWKDVKPIQRIKSLHGPITYLVLAVLFARKYTWAWKNPAWWFGVAFCVKWFRARYVFKVRKKKHLSMYLSAKERGCR
jgi:hypothetical protein